MRLVPRSLFGRFAWLLLGTVLLSQLVAVLIFGASRERLIAQQTAEQIFDVLADAEQQLEGLPVAARDRFLDAYNHPGGINLVPADGLMPPELTPSTREQRSIMQALAAGGLVIDDARVERDPVNELWLAVTILDKPYWLILPLGRLHSEVGSTWPLTIVAFLAIVLFAASWMAWRMSLPLAQLHRAAARLERGETPEPLVESGPDEFRLLSRQFNRTVQALHELEGDRRIMLAGVSHDLRTPLTRMRLSVEMMDEAWLRDGMLTDLSDIERILKQFSDYARGEPDEALERIDLYLFARDVVEPYQRDGKPVSLDDNHPLLDIPIRPVAVRRLLGNLIDNALRYGQPPVTVRVHQTDGCLWLQVHDGGSGFPDEATARLLRPFTRGEAARTADGGSGLGLAMVKRIADAHAARLAFLKDTDGFSVGVGFPLPAAKPARKVISALAERRKGAAEG
ncbi:MULTISPECIES: ATP-binding protein [Microvirgula]|uniref:histidine kinase n=1 Tax=Microvirgula aerodenitrificans TaxID=57480 RepID=A0A2S0P6L7_9NEIS|nr:MULTISPECIES: ATP-binding protein [Microvirgula]AVY93049.1 HAMP domain-containing protein [Microvirgula aerodenitrificans]RAS11972.1 two-component system osmolarity sensor histidine kinase EnvZ [Microvirgula sp. AG722]